MRQTFGTKVAKNKISDKALLLLNNREIKLNMAFSLEVSERWISKCIKVNKPNGFLTRASTLTFIKKVTGLKESEILENVQVSEPVSATR